MSLLRLKTKLAVFTRATMPKSTSVVPKHTRTPLGGTNYPELDDIEINPVHGKQIADSYEALKHNPNDPVVKESYDALINETKQQYDELIKGGLKIDPIIDNSNAYKSSDDMHLDLEKNKHINFFPTEKGFGSNDKYSDHPMLQPSGIKLNDKELLNNDVFRIVHDVQGHYRGQASGFGPKGEQQAYLTHAQMFSDKARKALFTETAGQNNWVNFGPKGEHNRKNPKNTIYADQKAGILPDEIVNGEWHKAKRKTAKQKIAVKFTSSFGPDLDAIESFKKGVDYQGFTGKGKNKRLKFEVANGGTELRLHGHVIAKKTKNGIAVSNAGFDTGLTYSALKELGVNAKRLPNGRVQLHNKELDAISGKFVEVPLNEISKTPIRATKPISKNKNPNRTVSEQSNFRSKVLHRELSEQNQTQLPLSSTAIQPKDQKLINQITGVKSKIPKKSLATDAHHILPVSKFPGLKNNPNNGIFQTRKEHTELERLNPPSNYRRLAKLKLKLALLEPLVLKKKKPKVIKKVSVKEGMIQTAKMLSADAIINNFLKIKPDIKGKSGVFDPIEGRVLDAYVPRDAVRIQQLWESKGKKIGFNSITDTNMRKTPETNIENIRNQLREIEKSGGNPALGFDEGSFEALNVSVKDTDEEILGELLDNQFSTGIMDDNLQFRIVENPKLK